MSLTGSGAGCSICSSGMCGERIDFHFPMPKKPSPPHAFAIQINKRQWIGIEIFDTHKQYLRRYKQAGGFGHKSYACFVPQYKRSGLFGVLMFSHDKMGVGIVAHEMTHFLYRWMLLRYTKLLPRYHERFANLMDYCHREFWAQYYKIWPGEKA